MQSIKQYWDYVKKRFFRLVVPSWVVIVLLLIIKFILGHTITTKYVLYLFIFNDGIPFFWIIRVYFVLALALPIICYFYKKNKYMCIISALLIYLTYEVMCSKNIFEIGGLSYLALYFGPCIFLSVAVIILSRYNAKVSAIISIFLFAISFFVILIINGKYISIRDYKNPLRIYYLLYGFFVYYSLYYLIEKVKKLSFVIKTKRIKKVIVFISNNSLWIYLIHTIVVNVSGEVIRAKNWEVQLLINLVGSMIIVWLKNCVINKFGLNNKPWIIVFKG